MAGSEKICWNVPESEWSETVEYVVRNKGSRNPYLRVFAESAMEEMLDLDSLRETEDLVEEYESIATDDLDGFSQDTYSISDEETCRVQMYLRKDLVQKFRQVVDECTDHANRYGIPFAKALHHYRTGGREQRINDRIRRLIESETEDEMSETETYDPDEMDIHYNDVDLSRLDGRSRKKKRYEICQNLDPDPDQQLHRSDIVSAIENVAGSSAIEAYLSDVVETLGYTTHPGTSKVYVTPADAEDIRGGDESEQTDDYVIAEEYKNADRGGFDELSREERLIKIRIELARRGKKSGYRKYKRDYNFIKNQVFDRQTSPGYANNAMNDAAEADGFSLVTKDGEKRLEVDLEEIGNELRKVLASDDRNDESPESTDEPETTDDEGHDTDDSDDHKEQLEEEVSEHWEQYEQGHPAMGNSGEKGYAGVSD